MAIALAAAVFLALLGYGFLFAAVIYGNAPASALPTLFGRCIQGLHPNCHHYLPQGFTGEIPRPPEGSEAREAQALLALQALRTPERLADIRRQDALALQDFERLSGIDLRQRPEQAQVFERLMDDATSVIFHWKLLYNRARPHVVLPAVQPVIEVPWHPAYPSGHATQGRLIARFYACLRPDLANALLALGDEVGRNRETAGVHYRSDTLAGQALADQIWGAAMENPELRQMCPRG